ncbi:MAG TPA: alpha/beta fold hydrolase [Actinomycetota bacterium]|nr:alpha/beta fold hydrolase [Actinomycetota bacterium]
MPDINVSGVKVAYGDTGGGGKALLFLNAFPLNRRMWEPQVESLSDRFRVITVDFQGFGESDVVADRSTYSMDTFAGQAKGVIDELGVSRVVLTGLSMGGYAALAFLRLFPESVEGLVLADSRAEADAPEAIEKRTGQQKLIESEGPAALRDGLLGALLSDATREKKPDVVANVTELMDNSGEGYIGALEAMKARPDSTSDLAGISVPTLVIVGENDTLTPPDLSRKIHENVGGSRLVVIPESGHLSNLEAPEAFNGALAEFAGSL